MPEPDPTARIEALLERHDARGEDRPDDPGLGRPGGHRPRWSGRLSAGRSAPGRSAPSAICGARSGPARCSGSRSRRRASAFRCCSSWTSSTATAPSSRCRSPRSAAFDPDLWERTARVAAIEAAADGLAMTYAPMLDVARDPRWGRIAESPGEDPWLAARFARRQGARLSGRRPRGGRQPGRDRQASGRLRRGHRRPRLCRGRRLGALACTRSTCRRSARRWPPASPRSCRRSTTSPACR